MDLIDDKFINLLSTRLEKFKKVKPSLYNCRCPICGDSQKNKSKARGYFYNIKNNTNYKCHNCGVNLSFNNFLKQVDPVLHRQYSIDKFKTGNTGKNFVVEEPKFDFKKPKFQPKLNLPRATENEEAKKYLESRKLNPNKFYYSEKFKSWVNSIQHTFSDLKYEESRIVIPLFYNNKLVGLQGRSLNSKSIKYITIMLDDDAPKIYGLDEVQKNKTVYITEGPFDSTFISNSIALCGADGDLDKWNICNRVWIYDNEPRNAEIHKRIAKCIGKKHFWTRQKDRKTGRRKTKESDWQDYMGSCDELKEDVKLLGNDKFLKEILYLCPHKKSMSFYETMEQFKRDVILREDYYNTNVEGKFFSSEVGNLYSIVEKSLLIE